MCSKAMLAAFETSVLQNTKLLLLLKICEVIETECMTQVEMENCDQKKKDCLHTS